MTKTAKMPPVVLAPPARYFELLDLREKEFVLGKLAGKTNVDAAISAGYSKSWAYGNAHLLMRRETIRQALGLTLSQLGLDFKAILQPVLEGLKATRTVYHGRGEDATKETIPDMNVRLKSAGLALKLLEWETQHSTPQPFTPDDAAPIDDKPVTDEIPDEEAKAKAEQTAYKRAWLKRVEKLNDVELIDAVFAETKESEESIKSEKTQSKKAKVLA